MGRPVWRSILSGVKSIFITPAVGAGGTLSARYYYSVYLRHLIMAARFGLTAKHRTVVELGPGDTLGIGFMAILTGAYQYYAIDAVRHASMGKNLAIFDELKTMLKARADIPFDLECAAIRPELDDYRFPSYLLDDVSLDAALSERRVERYRNALSTGVTGGPFQYIAPMGRLSEVPSSSVDLILSQAVMEHVDDPGDIYRECFRCMKPGGIMSHQIDFSSHDTSPDWNGHWKYPDAVWGLMRGQRAWFINRLPVSAHRKMIEGAGFRIEGENIQLRHDGICRDQLASVFHGISDDDLETAGALVLSVKRPL